MMHLNRHFALAAACLCTFASPPARAQSSPRQIQATRLAGAAPAVDGRLDDAAWRDAAWTSDFTLREPVQGATPPERTEVAFLIDGTSLYVAARMRSLDPAAIRALVGRRDRESASEQVIVSLDTYHDRRTAYTFAVNAAGVRLDYYQRSDSESDRDYSYDPVWDAAVSRDSAGWLAEMRIPLTQLRFNGGVEQRWGVNVVRRTPARNEAAYWVLVGRDETGWSSRMGELTGLGVLRPPRRVELTPYVAADGRLRPVDDPRDPFQERRQGSVRAGGDVKVGLGPSFTFDATLNPDFGQVEADPAEVNLTAFETIQAERRPFFTQGMTTGLFGSRGLFYSRRIGAPPAGRADADFAERRDATTILGAAKVVGRTPRGFSVGALGALTARETVSTYDTASNSFGRAVVAPPAAFGAVTAQQEIGRDRSTVGFLLTGVRRDVDGPLSGLLARDAVSGLVDGRLRWAGGKYDLDAYVGFSRVAGDSGVITALQRSSRRYYQRPDARHSRLDPGATTLSGTMLGVNHSKMAGRHWLWDVDYYEERPGLELNDLGRLGAADDRGLSGDLRYRETVPGWLHAFEVGLYRGVEWNFDGVLTSSDVQLFGSATTRGFWELEASVDYYPRVLSDNLTRGGPLMQTGREWTLNLEVANPAAARTRVETELSLARDELNGWNATLSTAATLRPGTRWELSLEPGVMRGVTPRQYVTQRGDGGPATYGGRYVFAHVERSELAARVRLNYALSPDLTLETYAEPFASSGRYRDFGELAPARGRELRTYGEDGTTLVRNTDGSLTVTDGPARFTLRNPDFTDLSFRSNVVLRWEWRPGSTLFAVWQQDRGASAEQARTAGAGDLWDSLRARGSNFLSLKATYWIPLR